MVKNFARCGHMHGGIKIRTACKKQEQVHGWQQFVDQQVVRYWLRLSRRKRSTLTRDGDKPWRNDRRGAGEYLGAYPSGSFFNLLGIPSSELLSSPPLPCLLYPEASRQVELELDLGGTAGSYQRLEGPVRSDRPMDIII